MSQKFFTNAIDQAAFLQATRAMDMYTQEVKLRERLTAEAKQRDEARYQAELDAKLAIERQQQAEEQRVNDVRNEVNFLNDPAKLTDVMTRYKTGDKTRQDDIKAFYARAADYHRDAVSKIDFAGLPFDGKVMFLPAYLGLLVGKDYPRLDLGRSDPGAGVYVFISHYGPADAVPWREAMPLIKRYLGGNWAATELDGTSMKLWRIPDLADPLLFDPSLLRTGELLFGADRATGQPYYTPFSKLTHLLVTGQPGKGKSIWTNTALGSLLWNLPLIERITLVDLKMVELNRYAGLHPKIELITEYGDLFPLVEKLTADMRDRFLALKARGEVAMTKDAHFVIIEEFGSILNQEPIDKAGKDKHKAMLASISRIGQLGRAANIKLIITSQRPTGDNLDTNLKANLPSTMSFAMSSPQNVQAMFNGETLPADVTTLPRGDFVYRDDGQGNIVHLKGYFRDPLDLEGIKACIHPSERRSHAYDSDELE